MIPDAVGPPSEAGRITIRLESIGDDQRARMREFRRGRIDMRASDIVRAAGLEHRGPWVAEITGLDDAGRMAKRLLWGQKSYAEANGIGSRGVYFYYHLEPGRLYQVQVPRTWARVERYFCRGDAAGWRIVPDAKVMAACRR